MDTFPETKVSLIQRLVKNGAEQDWAEFVTDYWGPVCRFAAWRGRLCAADAEDVASLTFEVLVRTALLARWLACRVARLRTLVSRVVRNILANQERVRACRARLLADLVHSAGDRAWYAADALPPDQEDAFYAGWAESLVQQAVDGLCDDYHEARRGDYFRVLYGKICEGLSNAQVALALGAKVTDVENYYRHARQQLSKKLKALLNEHVARYCKPQDVEGECADEWVRLGFFLQTHGGLEAIIRRAHAAGNPFAPGEAAEALVQRISSYLSEALPRPAERA